MSGLREEIVSTADHVLQLIESGEGLNATSFQEHI